MNLHRQVLVLNRHWQPVHICPVKRAFGLLFLGHADVVSTIDESFLTHDISSWLRFSTVSGDETGWDRIQTVSRTILVPEVIVLKLYDRIPRRDVKFSRQKVLQRDNFICQYCGDRFPPKQLNVDHVVPRQKGGKTSWDNLVCSCIPCNTRKANKLPHEARMFPIRSPRPPKWTPLGEYAWHDPDFKRKSWSFFISPAASKVELTC
jgi:5-methylcytosine-specific restriction endonuclease McrA